MGEGEVKCDNAMSDRAVYLGNGVWWQLTERQRRKGIGRGLPEIIRPSAPFPKSQLICARCRHAD